MWFHTPFKADEWLLYDITSPHAHSGVALSTGHLYRRDTGALAVTCVQQGIVRLAKPSVQGAITNVAFRGAKTFRALRDWFQGKYRS
mmetsp:Transcript_2371/g.5004  ORF Transcript_2371/g.5004 Transcript_2371/m.5004 type:complete len:87 (-) Transcript_2371:121-381(-)